MPIFNADRLGKLPLRADVLAQQRRLRELEDRIRKQNQAHWQHEPIKDDETEGWLLSYLDLLTLLLVMFVALLTLSGSPKDGDTTVELAASSTASGTQSSASVGDTGAGGGGTLSHDTHLVGSTAHLAERWKEIGNLSWVGLTPGMPDLPVSPPLPFDSDLAAELTATSSAESTAGSAVDARVETTTESTAGPLPPTAPPAALPLAVEMPYTPVPALAALAPPRPSPATDPDLPEPGLSDPSLLPKGLNLDLLGEGIDVIVRERSVSFRISSELLFGLGQTDLTAGGQDVLERVLAVLQSTDLPITVEGHTDPIPIRNERFPSNWELSTARATSVLRRLIEGGIDPVRLRAIGYADTRALAPNDTPAGRALNRRVEVILEVPTQDSATEPSPSSLQESS